MPDNPEIAIALLLIPSILYFMWRLSYGKNE